MIILYTPDEEKILEKIDERYIEIITHLNSAGNTMKQALEEQVAQIADLQNEFDETLEQFEQIRFSRLQSLEEVAQDIKASTNDYILYIAVRLSLTTPKENNLVINMAGGSLLSSPAAWEYSGFFLLYKNLDDPDDHITFRFNAAGLYEFFVESVFHRHLAALEKDPVLLSDTLKDLKKIIDDSPFTVLDLPEGQEVITAGNAIFRTTTPMYHGKATDLFVNMTRQDLDVTSPLDKGFFQMDTQDGYFRLIIEHISDISSNMSINVDKLYKSAISEFTRLNGSNKRILDTRVAIPFDEYARKSGYEIDERETITPEEAAKEKKRAREMVKSAKKRIRQDLDVLYHASAEWQETIKGKSGDFSKRRLVSGTDIKDGYIIIEFGYSFAQYLTQCRITQFHNGLLGLDARNRSAYLMGLKMNEHYNIDNNRFTGTYNRLKVLTLIIAAEFPTIEDLKEDIEAKIPDDTRHWKRRIKIPFEKALQTLEGRFLSSWHYVADDRILTPEEAKNIDDYEVFCNLLVVFELLDAADHTDRLEKKAKKKAASEAKKAAMKKAAQEVGKKFPQGKE